MAVWQKELITVLLLFILVAIVGWMTGWFLLFMRADTPYKTLDDIRNAKTAPRCAATGVGTSGHDVPKLFDEMIGLKFTIALSFNKDSM